MSSKKIFETGSFIPPAESKSTGWKKIVFIAIVGFGILVGFTYAGYWYGRRSSNLESQIVKPQLKTQISKTPTATPTPIKSVEIQNAEEIAKSLCQDDGAPAKHGAHLDKWSDDKNYVTCESGTAAAVRGLYVINIKKRSISTPFSYRDRPYSYDWSPNGYYLAYSKPEHVNLSRHPVEYLNEGSMSTSLVLYDAKNEKFDVVFKGDEDNGYLFVAWKTPDELIYKWFDPQNPDFDVPNGTPSKCFSYNLTTKQSRLVKCE